MGKSTISMVIFNSYVKLPEGISENFFRNIQMFQNGVPESIDVTISSGHFRIYRVGTVILFQGPSWVTLIPDDPMENIKVSLCMESMIKDGK